jgi:hypothetical protein
MEKPSRGRVGLSLNDIPEEAKNSTSDSKNIPKTNGQRINRGLMLNDEEDSEYEDRQTGVERFLLNNLKTNKEFL